MTVLKLPKMSWFSAAKKWRWTPPPAAMSMMTEPGPISSMTWMAEFLTDDIVTTEGWFLVHHEAQATRDGYSSQSMRMWNADGQPMMIGRQTIAVFA